MLGVIYLLLGLMLGYQISYRFLNYSGEKYGWKGNRLWLYFPTAFGVGMLCMGWLTYIVAYAGSVWGNMEQPLKFGNLVSMGGAAVYLFLVCFGKFYKKGWQMPKGLVENKRQFLFEVIFFLLLLAGLNWIFFYVFHVTNGRLYSGFTVFGDYAPHTAMMRSFSMENNYPTQYPHFGGEDVKYHFMFQFLTGNLEYLGMRIDVAYNVLSLFMLGGFLMLLYLLAQRIVKSMAAGFLTVFFFFFRSSLSFWIYAWENFQAGTLWEALTKNTAFIGYTTNENWGLWNFNVYLNQRHLAMGLLLTAAAVWIYLDWLEESFLEKESAACWVKKRLFTLEAWKWKNPSAAIFVGVILGACSFWNGAAVIGGLLILFGFAACSDGKLDYALTALTAVLLSLLQTNIFIHGSAMSFSFQWGFLASDKTLWGVLEYLLIMSGIFFIGLVIPAILMSWRERAMICAFFIPTIFAFTCSLTPDIAVNHKYIMISYAFLAMFWAGLLVKMWKRAVTVKIAAVLLAVILTITGIYDFVVILLDNDERHRVSVDLNSELTAWLSENLDHEDLVLTPQYSMNEVTMSGVMMYSGWPYYAWSAGYDTYYRAACAVEIYTADTPDYVEKLLRDEGITYVIFEDGMEYEEQECREDVIAEICTQVFISEDGGIRIYEV